MAISLYCYVGYMPSIIPILGKSTPYRKKGREDRLIKVQLPFNIYIYLGVHCKREYNLGCFNNPGLPITSIFIFTYLLTKKKQNIDIKPSKISASQDLHKVTASRAHSFGKYNFLVVSLVQ
jgi:hypothetical protein